MAIAFQNKNTGKTYLVKSWDKDSGHMVLTGPAGDFTERFSKEQFKQVGYRPVEVAAPKTDDDVEEDDDA